MVTPPARSSTPTLILLGAFLLLAASNPADDFVYPGSRLLVERQVNGKEIQIRWRCFAVKEPVAVILRHYAADVRLAKGRWRMAGDERGFQATNDPNLHIAVFPAELLGTRVTCRAELAADERSVIQISQAVSVEPTNTRPP